jgi:hypothetical protein
MDLKKLQAAGYTFQKLLGGSTGAILARNPEGNAVVLKRGASPAHIQEEFLANKLYEAWGTTSSADPRVIKVPPARMLDEFGEVICDFEIKSPNLHVRLGFWMESEHIQGPTLGHYLEMLSILPQDEAKARRDYLYAEIRKGFIADVLFQNWDVAGLDLDNILVNLSDPQKPVPYRIDLGGALRYRALGAPKPKSERPWLVEELYTFLPQEAQKRLLPRGNLIPTQSNIAEIYGEMTAQELHDMAMRLDRDAHRAVSIACCTDPELGQWIKNRLAGIQSMLSLLCPQAADGDTLGEPP